MNVETNLRQFRRDAAAARVWKRMQNHKPPGNYILYLRPFFVTNRLSPVDHPQRFVDELDRVFAEPSEYQDFSEWIDWLRDYGVADIESVISHAASPWGRTIALGHPKEAVGVARIETDEVNWKQTFATLAHHAKYVIMIPSSSSGTMYEIQWLIDHDLLARCIFVMPAAHWSDKSSHDILPSTMEWPSIGNRYLIYPFEWDKAIQALEGCLKLPSFTHSGGMFRLGRNGVSRFEKGHWHELWAVWKTRKTIKQLLSK